LITLSAYLAVLGYYDLRILGIYSVFTGLSLSWSFYFLRKRRILDYYRFQLRSENQDSIYEILNGVTEIKLNQLEEFKRKNWEEIQLKLFSINLRILKLDQIQLASFEFVNQLKNILVTYYSATYVVAGRMTLGELLSISFIIGQMNSPVNQMVSFIRSLQDARLSLERLNEVQSHVEEEKDGSCQIGIPGNQSEVEKGIRLSNVSFQYGASRSPFVLNRIDLFIPDGKTTAIVGSSGSGKTTLMKLLLKFYEPAKGVIYIDGQNLSEVSPSDLRGHCGVVMQDGFIFSDTIERNIATSDHQINKKKLFKAIRTANIEEFVNSLPLKELTKIGASGNGISGGQKQRILIARAVYKDPKYIFFDEATSSLDAENEKKIHDNLLTFFRGKTVIIIAHRLSTVKNADQIIVMKNGSIVEQGNHLHLIQNKADYFDLVRDQLELGA